MTTAARNPITLAREVLETAHEDDTITVCSVPDNKTAALARAVIDLTTKVERMEALADRLDVVANELEADGEDGYADAARTDAHSIRAALNGEIR